MLVDDILRGYTNAVYGVSAAVAKLRAQEPESSVLAAGAAKARRLAGETAVRSEPGCGYCGWFLYLVVIAFTGGGF